MERDDQTTDKMTPEGITEGATGDPVPVGDTEGPVTGAAIEDHIIRFTGAERSIGNTGDREGGSDMKIDKCFSTYFILWDKHKSCDENGGTPCDA